MEPSWSPKVRILLYICVHRGSICSLLPNLLLIGVVGSSTIANRVSLLIGVLGSALIVGSAFFSYFALLYQEVLHSKHRHNLKDITLELVPQNLNWSPESSSLVLVN